MLDDLGLEPTLKWYTHRQAALTGLKTQFRVEPLENRLDPVVETECFRVAQEALTNVVRHAQAREVTVSLSSRDGQLHLSVSDDGVGFDAASLREDAVRGASLGLLSMEERTALAGGGFETHYGFGTGHGSPCLVSVKMAGGTGLDGSGGGQMNSAPKSIRVVLADDHPIVRAGIRTELQKLPEVEIVGEASDGREALALVRLHQPDVVFMDISMRGLNGLEATARLAKEFPKVRVIILSMHQNDEYFWQALKLGASGYLLKKAATAELATALRRVVGGEIYLSREMSNRLAKKLPLHQIAHRKSPLEQLTSRQREILQLIAEGQTTKAIALILNVSPKTVEYHRAQLMQRLSIFDIPGLVRFALQTGLIAQE